MSAGGIGKSMLASRLPSILPPLSPGELLEVSMIASVAGEIAEGALTDARPFRAPHHSASMPALVGGGLRARPGEVSLAHHGVLFLDEFPEFQPQVLDSLRQPLVAAKCRVRPIIASLFRRASCSSRPLIRALRARERSRLRLPARPHARCAADIRPLSGP